MLAREGKNPFKLDSKAPKITFEDYAYTETRYKMLTKSNPEEAKQADGSGRGGCEGAVEAVRRDGAGERQRAKPAASPA